MRAAEGGAGGGGGSRWRNNRGSVVVADMARTCLRGHCPWTTPGVFAHRERRRREGQCAKCSRWPNRTPPRPGRHGPCPAPAPERPRRHAPRPARNGHAAAPRVRHRPRGDTAGRGEGPRVPRCSGRTPLGHGECAPAGFAWLLREETGLRCLVETRASGTRTAHRVVQPTAPWPPAPGPAPPSTPVIRGRRSRCSAYGGSGPSSSHGCSSRGPSCGPRMPVRTAGARRVRRGAHLLVQAAAVTPSVTGRRPPALRRDHAGSNCPSWPRICGSAVPPFCRSAVHAGPSSWTRDRPRACFESTRGCPAWPPPGPALAGGSPSGPTVRRPNCRAHPGSTRGPVSALAVSTGGATVSRVRRDYHPFRWVFGCVDVSATMPFLTLVERCPSPW